MASSTVWLYYNGNSGLHQYPGDSVIGIAKWRLDGFVSIDNLPGKEVVITTKPLTHDEPWVIMERGGLVVFRDGLPVAN